MTPRLIAETAVAWGLSVQEVQQIVFWIEENIEPQWKSRVFTQLLRQHRERHLESARRKMARNVEHQSNDDEDRGNHVQHREQRRRNVYHSEQ